jgi:hypothetical protein
VTFLKDSVKLAETQAQLIEKSQFVPSIPTSQDSVSHGKTRSTVRSKHLLSTEMHLLIFKHLQSDGENVPFNVPNWND